MKFLFEKIPSIPALAWCAKIQKGDPVVKILHGTAVVCREDFFCAGVWDGLFEDGNFAQASFSCCTGGKIQNGGGVMFSTPNHTQEALYSVGNGGCLYLSNSLPFLLVESGARLDEKFYHYEEVFCSLLKGIGGFVKNVPLACGKVLRVFRCSNLLISEDCQITEDRKRSNFSFSSYADYVGKLAQALDLIKKNARSEFREHKYGMISTISRGYDAPAVSAMAKEAGCDRVFTFTDKAEDNGVEIAKALKYSEIIECDSVEYKKNENFLEAEACSMGEVGNAVVFSGWERLYSGSLLFMGCRGDSVWALNHPNVNDDYDFSWGNGLSQSTSSFCENFFRNNTVGVFLPLCGADKWSEISKISNSAEMLDFSVGGDYDRPIPRRILEERGINRENFGQAKFGAGISYHFDTLSSLRRKMSPASYRSFEQYFRSGKQNFFSYRKRWALHVCREFPSYFNWLAHKLRLPFGMKTKQAVSSSPIASLLIHWGVSEMMKRYQRKEIE